MMRLALLLGALLAAPDGDRAPDFALKDLEGRERRLSALAGKPAVVLVFTGIECPRGRAAEARLADLAARHPEVPFLAINANRNESADRVAAHVKAGKWPLPVVRDVDGRVAALYGVEVQPTALVLDPDLRIRYRGAIDDHKNEEFVRSRYLRDALEAVLAGKEPPVRETKAEGCSVKSAAPAEGAAGPTYAKDVAPILNAHCVSCHRPGQVGPFTLDDPEQASAWSREIAVYARRKLMPPWKPTTNEGAYYNERRLSDAEIATLEAWHAAGAPLGDLAKAPAKPSFGGGWMLGTPDLVLKAEGGYVVGPKGPDEYRCYVIRNPCDEDKWVVGVEYRPGNLSAVHHVIGYLDPSGASEKRDAADPQPGYRSNGSGPGILPSGSLAGWAPGNLPRMLPEGVARRWRKGERIVLETHYHRTGRPELDEGAQVALYFAKAPVKKRLGVQTIANFLLRIPAGADAHKVVAVGVIPENRHALDVMPHMHLLGRKVSVTATLPDGTVRDLVRIEDWDFNWQETYQFREPVALPRGTRIRVEAVYDNSPGNRSNPSNPPRDVRWGEETTDEMCIAFIHYTRDVEDLTKPKDE